MKTNLSRIKDKCKELKHKLTQKIKKMLIMVLRVALITTIVVGFMLLAAKAPEIHGAWVRAKVGSKVYKVYGPRGSGSGFAAKAESGLTYIVTNDHVCRGVSKNGVTVWVEDADGNSMERRIISMSGKSDLCLVEGWPGVEGLSVASSAPSIGQIVASVGHPAGYDTTMSRGEIIMKKDIEIPVGIISLLNPQTGEEFLIPKEDGGVTKEECSQPKNRIVETHIQIFIFIVPAKICTTVTEKAYWTNMLVQPGSSGSPLVDFWGNLVGVVFASDRAGWGMTVSHKDLKEFLSIY